MNALKSQFKSGGWGKSNLVGGAHLLRRPKALHRLVSGMFKFSSR